MTGRRPVLLGRYIVLQGAAALALAAACVRIEPFKGPLRDLATQLVKRNTPGPCVRMSLEDDLDVLQHARFPVKNCGQLRNDSLINFFQDADGKILLVAVSVQARDMVHQDSLYTNTKDSLSRHLGIARACRSPSPDAIALLYWEEMASLRDSISFQVLQLFGSEHWENDNVIRNVALWRVP